MLMSQRCGCGQSNCNGNCGCGGCTGVIADGVSITGNGCPATILRGYRIEPVGDRFIVTRPDGTLYEIVPGDQVEVDGLIVTITHPDGTTESFTLHPAATLTKVQDVTNRGTFDPTTQVLNLPPAIAARIVGLVLDSVPGYLVPLQVLGMTADYDTVGGTMALANQIVIPRVGRYNLVGSWGTDEPGACTDFTLLVSVAINGVPLGRYTAPSNTLADQVLLALPGQLLQAGDVLTLLAYTDCNDPDLRVTSAYLAAEYIEGT